MTFKTGSNNYYLVSNNNSIFHNTFDSNVFAGIQYTETIIANTVASDAFGAVVRVGSNRIIVSASSDSSANVNAGAAYVYDLNGTKLFKLTPSGATQSQAFSGGQRSVAVNHGRIAVGAYADDDLGTNAGAVYLFDMNGNVKVKVKPSDGVAADNFGEYLALNNNRLVVGVPYQDNGNTVTNSGAVYIFDLDGTQIAKIRPEDGATGTAANMNYGYSVDVGYGKIVVGAPGYSISGGNSAVGAVYIHDLLGNQIKKIESPVLTSSYNFGKTVAIGCGRIIVGTYKDNDNGTFSGALYIYNLNGEYITKVKPFDGAALDYFGLDVAIGDGYIASCSSYDDDLGTNSGALYLFNLNGVQQTKIKATNGASNNYYGSSVSIHGGRIVVGTLYNNCAYIYYLPEDHNIYFEKVLDSVKY